MDRLGVGYERAASRESRARLLRDLGLRAGRALHAPAPATTSNYLALAGLLGLTGRAGGPPVQSAGQIADIGGGALMAAFGILAALRERERSGEGQLVDVSMIDGALSWLAMVAARYFCEQVAPARGEPELDAAGSSVTGPTSCKDGVGDARRARAEVLARVVRRRRSART